MTPLKFGIIGCSRIAKRSVIPAIQKSEFAELEIIGSRSTDKAKEFAKKFNCEKFGTYDDVISSDSVDVVYISTPIDKHAEWSNKATAAGKHVYVEKSSTDNLKTAEKMVESAKENNVRLMEGFMFRFHPQHQKVKELIKDGRIGEIKSFNGVFGFPAFPVDTHIHRLAQRWGLSSGKNVVKTEEDLKKVFPKSSWNKLHLQIIFYGREFCTARGCDGRICEICRTCFPNRLNAFQARKG